MNGMSHPAQQTVSKHGRGLRALMLTMENDPLIQQMTPVARDAATFALALRHLHLLGTLTTV